MKASLLILPLIIAGSFAFADDTKMPKELSSLKESWTRARKQATDPVDKKFLDALEAMKIRFTKAGQLDSALAVDAEIKALSGFVTETAKVTAEEPTAKKDFAGHTIKYVGTPWSWELLADGTFKKLRDGQESGTGTYTIEADGRVRLGSTNGENFIAKSSKKGVLYKDGDDKTPKGEVTIEPTRKK